MNSSHHRPTNSVTQMNSHPNSQPQSHIQPNGHPQPPPQPTRHLTGMEYMTQLNELTWVAIGRFAETLGNNATALEAYRKALEHNPGAAEALRATASILRSEDKYAHAVEFIKNLLKLNPMDGESWSALGHCYLMMDELQQAYTAYQSALYNLRDPKEPKLWYGIGILYDRYGSLDHAEEAFSQVMRMEPNFEKANEIYFRLGIIYKQQAKFKESLECFQWIVDTPPHPLNQTDIWFQIGHVYEQQKDYVQAKEAYLRVLERDPKHAKVLQQLGWLHHQQSSDYSSQDQAIEFLEQSVASDGSDAQSWYLLGRCYMSQHKFPKAYEAYQQAVYRDGRNPTFWCSIGVLYYQINQYRDALDAYSRAIRLNPNISEVWYDLGTLYESCNNQTSDALDAYQRAAELDPHNQHIQARLQLLRNGASTGLPNQNGQPMLQDVPARAYQPGPGGPAGHPQWSAQPAHGGAPPPAPPQIREWNQRANEPTHGHQPQSAGGYDHRDQGRMPQPRQTTPRPDSSRHYDAHRHTPMNHRQRSISPRSRAPINNNYRAPPLPAQAPQPPNRMPNPNYSAHITSPPVNHAPLGQPPAPPYSNQIPEIRPIVDNPHSPRSGQSQSKYPDVAYGGIMSGAPAPSSAAVAADAAQREQDGRSSQPPAKRYREWEENGEVSGNHSKKSATEENRVGSDDGRRDHEVQSTQQTTAESQTQQHSTQTSGATEEEAKPQEPLRRSSTLNAILHDPTPAPSTQTLPPMRTASSSPPRVQEPKPAEPEPVAMEVDVPSPKAAPAEPAKSEEPAARKMDVDEDYDEESAEESKAAAPAPIPEADVPAASNGVNAEQASVEATA